MPTEKRNEWATVYHQTLRYKALNIQVSLYVEHSVQKDKHCIFTIIGSPSVVTEQIDRMGDTLTRFGWTLYHHRVSALS
jgi:hypothetical protein